MRWGARPAWGPRPTGPGVVGGRGPVGAEPPGPGSAAGARPHWASLSEPAKRLRGRREGGSGADQLIKAGRTEHLRWIRASGWTAGAGCRLNSRGAPWFTRGKPCGTNSKPQKQRAAAGGGHGSLPGPPAGWRRFQNQELLGGERSHSPSESGLGAGPEPRGAEPWPPALRESWLPRQRQEGLLWAPPSRQKKLAQKMEEGERENEQSLLFHHGETCVLAQPTGQQTVRVDVKLEKQ